VAPQVRGRPGMQACLDRGSGAASFHLAARLGGPLIDALFTELNWHRTRDYRPPAARRQFFSRTGREKRIRGTVRPGGERKLARLSTTSQIVVMAGIDRPIPRLYLPLGRRGMPVCAPKDGT